MRQAPRALATLFALLCIQACGDANETANRIFVDLAKQTTQATSDPDPAHKYDALVEVKSKVNDLVDRYPQSNAAVRIAADERIGLLSLREMQ